MSRREVIEESQQVPLWIITFSDMTTNLLTFFVLLLSLGTVRDDTLNDQGMAPTFLGEIKRGFGFKQPLDLGETKINHHISRQNELNDGRTINAKEEELRRVFEEIKQSANVVFYVQILFRQSIQHLSLKCFCIEIVSLVMLDFEWKKKHGD